MLSLSSGLAIIGVKQVTAPHGIAVTFRGTIVDSNYWIDTSEGLVRVQIRGEVRASGLIKLMGRIASDPRFRPEMDAIIDLREARGDWDYSEIQRLRDYVVRIAASERRRWAAIVSPGTLMAVAHVLIVISEPVSHSIRMQLFDDTQSALRWVKSVRRERPMLAGVVS